VYRAQRWLPEALCAAGQQDRHELDRGGELGPGVLGVRRGAGARRGEAEQPDRVGGGRRQAEARAADPGAGRGRAASLRHLVLLWQVGADEQGAGLGSDVGVVGKVAALSSSRRRVYPGSQHGEQMR